MKFLICLFLQLGVTTIELKASESRTGYATIDRDSRVFLYSQLLQGMKECEGSQPQQQITVPFSSPAIALVEGRLSSTPIDLATYSPDLLCEAANLSAFLDIRQSHMSPTPHPLLKYIFLELLKKASPTKHALVGDLVKPFNRFKTLMETGLVQYTKTSIPSEASPISIRDMGNQWLTMGKPKKRWNSPHEYWILSAALSTCGRYLVIGTQYTACMYDLTDNTLIKEMKFSDLEHKASIRARRLVAMSADGSTIAVSSYKKNVTIYNRFTDPEILLQLPRKITDIALSPQGDYLSIITTHSKNDSTDNQINTTMYIYDTQKNIFTAIHKTPWIGENPTISPNGKFVIVRVERDYPQACYSYFLYCADSDCMFNIRESNYSDRPVSVSDDGKTIMFETNKTYTYGASQPTGEFYTLTADMTELDALTLEGIGEPLTETAGAAS